MKSSAPIVKTRIYYYKISKLLYSLGAPNYYYKDFDIPDFIQDIHDVLIRFIDLSLVVTNVLMIGSFFTQPNLNEKQKTDRVMFAICIPICLSFIVVLSRKNHLVKEVAYNLAIKMKEVYNDEDVEQQMMFKAKFYTLLFGSFTFSMVILYGINGLIDVFIKGKNFVTIITAWPDIDDGSQIAGIARIIYYLIYMLFLIRIQSSVYAVVVLITVGISHQFKNICCYFRSLNDIFEDDSLTQDEKEEKYEKAFKVGINLHSNTLRCTKHTQEICEVVFSFQTLITVVALTSLMFQMLKSERTLTNVLQTISTGVCTLVSTGCFWWNAGDITVEAAEISTAMFHSGWHHCRAQAARKIRSMMVIAMKNSQNPVTLRCLGVVALSYSSFVTIVRTTYSVFSVLY